MANLVSRLYNWATDKTNSVKITAARQDGELDQLVAALNQKVLCATSAPGSPIAGQTWVDTTNKLLKIYRNNEWVAMAPVHVGTAAMATPQEADLWYDTTNNILKAYNGASWDVVITFPASSAQGDVWYLSAAATLARLAKDATATRYLSNTGASNNPAWALVNLANGVTGVLPLANFAPVVDVVAYTGDGNDNRTFNHSLGAAPDCVIIAKIAGGAFPAIFITGMGAGDSILFNSSIATDCIKAVNSTTVTVGTNGSVNTGAASYVAILIKANV